MIGTQNPWYEVDWDEGVLHNSYTTKGTETHVCVFTEVISNEM